MRFVQTQNPGEVARTFRDRRKSWTAETLADELNVPVRMVRDLLGYLERSGIVIFHVAMPFSSWPVTTRRIVRPMRHSYCCLLQRSGNGGWY